jgi:hypothetical protein
MATSMRRHDASRAVVWMAGPRSGVTTGAPVDIGQNGAGAI